jgi:hypothetical protein
MALADELGAERLRQPGTMPWYGPDYLLDDLIVHANYAHKREHCGEVRQFLLRSTAREDSRPSCAACHPDACAVVGRMTRAFGARNRNAARMRSSRHASSIVAQCAAARLASSRRYPRSRSG